MARIRWPLGTVQHTNAVTAAKSTLKGTPPIVSPAQEPPAQSTKKRCSGEGVSPNPPNAAEEHTPHEPAAKKRKHAQNTTKEPKGKLSELETQKANKSTPPTLSEARAAMSSAAADLLDVSTIIQLDDSERCPVWDTCDTIRRKIRSLLSKNGFITQAAFLRAIVTAAYGETSTKKIQSTSFHNFMKQKGPLAGNTNCVYYAAYVFFEKLRVKQGKGKTVDREMMEDVWPNGVNLTKLWTGREVYIGSVDTTLGMDKYGRLKAVY